MRNIQVVLSERRTGNILAMFIVFVIAASALIRLYPFENSLPDILTDGDDWGRYARYAMEIKHDGILIPSVNGNYEAPAGFLYNYFIALCFYVFGENIIPVYLIQSLLLGFSVVFIYLAFRDKMKAITGIAFLLTLFIFALLDVFKNYSFRLLSENLAVFTVSCFFLYFIKGMEKNKLSLQAASAFFLGLSVLSRPNIFPFAILLIAVMLIYCLKQKGTGIRNLIFFAAVFGLSMSFLCIRNHLVIGSWSFLPAEGISFGEKFLYNNNYSLVCYLKKILFCFGVLSPLDSNYQWRPHWIIMWIGYFIYLFFRIKEKRRLEIWEAATQLFILTYYGLLILIAQIGCYGYRQLIPAIFIVLAFSFMALDKFKIQSQNLKM